MKINIITLITLFFTSFTIAQTNIPQLVSFSAIVRDASNQPLVDTPISIRLTFKQGGQSGPLVYCALHQTITNQNGFMSLQLNRDVLGTGCNGAPSTTFQNIPWENGGFWMEVEYQTTPGSPFINLGQLELASSFYAFASGTAERISNFDLNGANDGDILSFNISNLKWEPRSLNSLNTDNQQLSVSQIGDTLRLQNGGFVIIPGISNANATPQLAVVNTSNVSNITNVSAVTGGEVINSGNSQIINRGVVWSNLNDPTLSQNIGLMNSGNGMGAFTVTINNLSPNTTYYVKAFVTNSVGTSYGEEVSFTTASISTIAGSGVLFDNYNYPSIILGNGQEWMSENLKTIVYSNGDAIVNLNDLNTWQNSTAGAYTIYENNIQNANIYGNLYNFYAVSDSRNICPTGWHVPNDSEWSSLINYLDPSANGGIDLNYAGGKLKSVGTSLWSSPNTGADNESGFSALPAGQLGFNGPFSFNLINNFAFFWTSSDNGNGGWSRSLSSGSTMIQRANKEKNHGFSVRCIKD
jgi:uncharacterized protein (TIGR02145 family)